ncbi:probable tRNA N6-adenosine threonylcarbamoyltransferase, mitochondrial isoform X2 [Odontomachus brunneus]|uniref:probable tRNA N6-adenosine threonylcarbamoyltransferase, mitochondrial isoform X2 n=1 Tax=Odontomachus brunneus TaxID=486640 RepID=UPI0013F1E9E6|nr:probable tRNA N6-adenosine threonylcarbamoyltransferase, mitochondrial isoform X2 [Odontomachus brunneus]XP_032666894.1 probable tRNA N6-adenosine threonylcarbamoyltransferase, mitochondrial isoform X2 [Odontomachus brunneus]XP_032666895.1 probable tRNA N6-adenosine threonylcarbamoyltransferase, mitochondrial isoform X2 [Odontomachus brunneus]
MTGSKLYNLSLTVYRHGGIIPTIASEIHRQHITTVCENALRSADLRLRDVDAVATTTMPGLLNSLNVGNTFGKYLSRVGNKPYIPIHHMEAHALTVRMTEKVNFPYLVLLISGGHSLLAIVDSVDKFYTLGTTLDNALGEVLDKIARRLKLINIPEFSHMSGGQAIENAATKATDPKKFEFSSYLTRKRDCQFSFGAIWSTALEYITNQEKELQIDASKIIPDAYNLCASLQWCIARHICLRTQRAMQFIDEMNLIPQEKRTLVISGGVACNNFFARALEIVCSEKGFQFVRTPPRLCNDNGVMIAWNGVERWIANAGVIRDRNEIETVTIEKKMPLGENWIEKVRDANIKCKLVKLNVLSTY